MDWRKYLSRRWLTHLAGLAAVIHLAVNGSLTWESMVGIVLIVASEGGTNVADHLLAIRSKEAGHE
jgi:hypothetical protein